MTYSSLARVYILIGSITCLTIADYLLTQRYINVVGIDGEANPLMHWIIASFGMGGVLLLKVLGALVLAFLVSWVPKASLSWIYKALISVNVVILFVVGMGFYAVGTTL